MALVRLWEKVPHTQMTMSNGPPCACTCAEGGWRLDPTLASTITMKYKKYMWGRGGGGGGGGVEASMG